MRHRRLKSSNIYIIVYIMLLWQVKKHILRRCLLQKQRWLSRESLRVFQSLQRIHFKAYGT